MYDAEIAAVASAFPRNDELRYKWIATLLSQVTGKLRLTHGDDQ